jgi:hypothetical protein
MRRTLLLAGCAGGIATGSSALSDSSRPEQRPNPPRLPVHASSESTLGSSWTAEGGSLNHTSNAWCTAACEYDSDEPAVAYAAKLGVGVFGGGDNGRLLFPSSPIVAASGVVVVVDSSCNLLLYQTPESLDPPPADAWVGRPQWWEFSVNFTASEASTSGLSPCTTPVLDPTASTVFFANPQTKELFGLNISRGAGNVPVPLSWSPLKLPAGLFLATGASSGASVVGDYLFLPLDDVLGALVVNIHTGTARASLFNGAYPGHPDPAILGPSVATAATAGAVPGGPAELAYIILGDSTAAALPRLMSIRANATAIISTWNTPAAYAPQLLGAVDAITLVDVIANEAKDLCIIAPMLNTKQHVLSMCAMSAFSGGPCMEWPASGCVQLVEGLAGGAGQSSGPSVGDATFVTSTAAVIPSDKSRSGSTVVHYVSSSHLLQVVITASTAVLTAAYPLGSWSYGIAPLVYIDAFSPGQHAIVVALPNATVLVFDAEDFTSGPKRTFVVGRAPGMHGSPVLVGPYMAATNNGTLLLLARDSANADKAGEAFLLGITPITGQSTAPPAGPPAGMNAAGKAFLIIFFLLLVGAFTYCVWTRAYRKMDFGTLQDWATSPVDQCRRLRGGRRSSLIPLHQGGHYSGLDAGEPVNHWSSPPASAGSGDASFISRVRASVPNISARSIASSAAMGSHPIMRSSTSYQVAQTAAPGGRDEPLLS